jgi:hypothetical protein
MEMGQFMSGEYGKWKWKWIRGMRGGDESGSGSGRGSESESGRGLGTRDGGIGQGLTDHSNPSTIPH